MSTKYPGGIISKTAPVPAGPFENGAAPGIWTLEQQAAYVKQGIWPIAGNTDPSAFIENLFQTWVYTGNGTTQTINNGIDLAGKGGMVWGKTRDAVVAHTITDTVRGVDKEIFPNLTDAQQTRATGTGSVFAFNSNGFSTSGVNGFINYSGLLEVAWTFREQAKFFDIVTWTGDGTNNRAISHSLGGTVGCLIVKRTSGTGDWPVWHRSLPAYGGNPQSKSTLYLNANLGGDADVYFGNTAPTSTAFYVDAAANASGSTYVAYLFAHNAGGFGLSGTENVITCGSYTGNGSTSGPTVNLGYEPQWVLLKRATGGTANWVLVDNMRGMTVGGDDQLLLPNTNDTESGSDVLSPTATGFQITTSSPLCNGSGNTIIYVAIRRGPMAVPTTGTSVFGVGTRSGSGSVAKTNSNVLTDLTFIKNRTSASEYWAWTPRLAGNLTLQSNSDDGQLTGAMATNPWDTMTGAFCAASNGATNSGSLIDYSFRRAPGFFDTVCFTGNSSSGGIQSVSHNLSTAPQLIFLKDRNNTGGSYEWFVGASILDASWTQGVALNRNAANGYWGGNIFGSAAPTASIFYAGGFGANFLGSAYVAYLFASCPGVSRIGSYTGTGATQVINCGFTGGARFVLIKATSTTGDWLVYDTARGMIPANDPYLRINLTAAEVTGTDWVDTASTGFELSNSAGNLANSNGVSYIFLAIA
jgi:hypothetical protein